MNLDRIKGNSKQSKRNVSEQLGEFNDDRLEVITGKHDSLAGKSQEKYCISKDKMEKQLADWQNRMKENHKKELIHVK